MWEKVNRNGFEHEVADRTKPISLESAPMQFANHPRHLLEKKHNDSCLFCRYDYGKNLEKYPEYERFWEKDSQCMSCKSGKGIFGEIFPDNGGKKIDKTFIAFQNVYFDLINLKFIDLMQFKNLCSIAVYDQTHRAVPEFYIKNENVLKDENFFDDNKAFIPVFNSCLGQTEPVTKVLLATTGSSFVERGIFDSFQIGTFIIGPGGLGKSDFQKFLRLLHGHFNCITPCQNTFGQKFSHGQFTGSLTTAFLPDEIHKDCGLSQQMWFNWVDQTEIQCEIKFKQALRTMPFKLYILWVANSFFPKFELSEALLRRALVIDINFFSFVKYSAPPSSLMDKTEVPQLAI
jgi:hypothetical protein